MVIEPSFNKAFDFHDGRARVEVNERYGFIDPSGTMVIEPGFEEASDFSEGVARVLRCTREKKCTQVNVGSGSQTSFSFLTGGELRLIDLDGDTITARDCYSLRSVHDGMAAYQVRVDGPWGFVDRTGAIVIEPQFENAAAFSEGLAAVQVGEKWGYVDKTGAMVIQPQFDSASFFSDALAAVKVDKQWGYLDHKGAMVIQPQFASIGDFSEGVAAVYDGDLWGFIDKSGAMVIQPRFDSVSGFSEGIARVWMGNFQDGQLSGYINSKGEYIWEPSK
jgi:hypothetical protein